MEKQILINRLLFATYGGLASLAFGYVGAAIHELGHYFACLWLGVPVESLVFTLFKQQIIIAVPLSQLDPWQNEIIAFSGGFTAFAVFVVIAFFYFRLRPANTPHAYFPRTVIGIGLLFTTLLELINAVLEAATPISYEANLQVLSLITVSAVFALTYGISLPRIRRYDWLLRIQKDATFSDLRETRL
jgi:hypothetical protein